MDFSTLLQQRQTGLSSVLQSLLGKSVTQSISQVTPKAKKKVDAAVKPKMETPSWMTDISSILAAMNTNADAADVTLPSIPVPDPLSRLTVSGGEERRLRRKKSGILAAIGQGGDTGGFGA